VILPSINSSEAFGIVLVEGMACGKPVLASDLSGVRAVVENGKNGFVFAPKNSLAIAEKIVALFSDEARYELLRKNCLAVVEEKYRWRVVAKKLNDVILS
jgi:glycosyltransferase involved in cell wall biosynthesis